MTKRRLPLSRHDAVAYAIAMLGEGGIRSATGKSLSMAYAWANPDDERELSFLDAAKLAAALTDGGCDGSRFSAAFAVEVGLRTSSDRPRSGPLDVRAQLIRLAAEFGKLAQAVEAATQDGVLDREDIASLMREANDVRAAAETIVRGLKAPLVAVAGYAGCAGEIAELLHKGEEA